MKKQGEKNVSSKMSISATRNSPMQGKKRGAWRKYSDSASVACRHHFASMTMDGGSNGNNRRRNSHEDEEEEEDGGINFAGAQRRDSPPSESSSPKRERLFELLLRHYNPSHADTKRKIHDGSDHHHHDPEHHADTAFGAACQACVSWQRSPTTQGDRCCHKCRRRESLVEDELLSHGGEGKEPLRRRDSDPVFNSTSTSPAVTFSRILTPDENRELLGILEERKEEEAAADASKGPKVEKKVGRRNKRTYSSL